MGMFTACVKKGSSQKAFASEIGGDDLRSQRCPRGVLQPVVGSLGPETPEHMASGGSPSG